MECDVVSACCLGWLVDYLTWVTYHKPPASVHTHLLSLSQAQGSLHAPWAILAQSQWQAIRILQILCLLHCKTAQSSSYLYLEKRVCTLEQHRDNTWSLSHWDIKWTTDKRMTINFQKLPVIIHVLLSTTAA